MKSAVIPPWRWSLNSVTGPSHKLEGTECQDACAIAVMGAHGERVLMAISDGAGSAARAREGAEIVVEHWLKHFSPLMSGPADPVGDIQSLGRSSVEEVLRSIRREADRRARQLGCSVSDFSATLLGAVVSPEGSFVAQVGDGCWVGEVAGLLACLTWPLQGEFASQTQFAISDSAAEVLQCVHLPSGLSALAGFTDGLERMALHLTPRIPEPGFFTPMFDLVSARGSGADTEICAFLDSERIQKESDDDKTLMLLVRNDRGLR